MIKSLPTCKAVPSLANTSPKCDLMLAAKICGGDGFHRASMKSSHYAILHLGDANQMWEKK